MQDNLHMDEIQALACTLEVVALVSSAPLRSVNLNLNFLNNKPFPCCRSQSLKIPSEDAAASKTSEGFNATHSTGAVWASKSWNGRKRGWEDIRDNLTNHQRLSLCKSPYFNFVITPTSCYHPSGPLPKSSASNTSLMRHKIIYNFSRCSVRNRKILSCRHARSLKVCLSLGGPSLSSIVWFCLYFPPFFYFCCLFLEKRNWCINEGEQLRLACACPSVARLLEHSALLAWVILKRILSLY